MASIMRICVANMRRTFDRRRVQSGPVGSAALLAVILVFGGATGCSGQPDGSEWVISSDPELVRVASELLPALAERSGLELRMPVRVERRSRAELEGYLQFKLDEELSPTEAEHQTWPTPLSGWSLPNWICENSSWSSTWSRWPDSTIPIRPHSSSWTTSRPRSWLPS